MIFGNRLKQLRLEKGLTQAQLGAFFNLAESTISLYETGKRTPHYDILTSLAVFFGVSADFLLGNTTKRYPTFAIEEEERSYAETDPDRPVKLPVVNKITLGERGLDYISDKRCEWTSLKLIDSGNYYWVRIPDNNMSADALLEGDLALIREQLSLDYGEIGLVLVNNTQYSIQRIFKNETSIVLQSSNPTIPPQIFTGNDRSKIRILGKVVQIRRYIKTAPS